MIQKPCLLANKCAVFTTSTLLSYQGSPVGDKCAGLAYSGCCNYLDTVAKREMIGDKIYFQGAVAFNRGVVAAFETILGKKINVPAYPHLTGAIGMAKVCMDDYRRKLELR